MEKRGDWMVDLTDEEKKLFYTGGNFKDYVFTFHDINFSITNETIHQESVTIKESIIEADEFTLGGCIASSIEFEVSEIYEYDLSGLEFSVELYINLKEDGTHDLKLPMGVYRVDSAEMVDDQDYKKIIAYDAMYDASSDVSKWYNSFFSDGNEHTVKEIRETLLTHLNIPFLSQDLPNDCVKIGKTIEPTTLDGAELLKAICTVNGGFGRINRKGEFEVTSLIEFGIFPEDNAGTEKNLYPSETLYPEDYFQYIGTSDEESVFPEYKTTKYEEYTTMPITCLNIQGTEDDVGITIGDDISNPYVISANYLLYGLTSEQLKTVGKNILNNIKGIVYRPNTTTLEGLPYLEVGDIFSLEKNRDAIESYIFSRELSGIQSLSDEYEAKGNYIRANEVSSNDEIERLKGKSLEIKKSVDGLAAELKDYEDGTSTSIELNAEQIKAEVARANKAEGELLSSIELNAEQIVLKVDENGNIVEASLSADPEDGTRFTVTAKNIELTAEDVLDLISNGTINLSGKNISIESDNFNVTSDGEVTASSILIDGGRISLDTSNSPDNLITLRNLETDAKDTSGNLIEVNRFGEGMPTSDEIEKFEVGDNYMNLSTLKIFRFDGMIETVPKFTPITTLGTPTTYWYETAMNTEEGFSVSQYYIKNEQKWGNSIDVFHDKITLKKDFYQASGQDSQEVNIKTDYIEGHDGFDMSIGLVVDRTVSVPGIILDGTDISSDDGIIKIGSPLETTSYTVESAEPSDEDYKTHLKGRVDKVGLKIDGYEFVIGSLVFNFTSSYVPKFPIYADGIVSYMPHAAGNGDREAQTFEISDTSVDEEEGKLYAYFESGSMVGGDGRVNYSYWRVSQ